MKCSTVTERAREHYETVRSSIFGDHLATIIFFVLKQIVKITQSPTRKREPGEPGSGGAGLGSRLDHGAGSM